MLVLEELLSGAGGLIFDCDGTLINSATLYSKAWAMGFATSGKLMSHQWYNSRHGLSEHGLMDDFERDHQVTLQRNQVVSVMRRTYLDNMASDLHELRAISQIAKRFKGKIPIAVASGGSREIVTKSLEALDLKGLFDAVVTFDDVGVAKPQPDIFIEAARRLSLEPEDCLVFEDSPQGIQAARRAGMPVVDVAHIL